MSKIYVSSKSSLHGSIEMTLDDATFYENGSWSRK